MKQPEQRFIVKLVLQACVCLLLFCNGSKAASDTILIDSTVPEMALRNHFRVVEDFSDNFNADSLLRSPDRFSSLNGFTPSRPDGIFWLKTTIKSEQNAEIVLSFQHLTSADLYFLPDLPGSAYQLHKAGAFRPAKEIGPGDSRFHFQLKLAAGVSYTILIRSWHTKQYPPVFDFQLTDLHTYNEAKQQQELVDHWFQGAAIVLLIYILITWTITRYRPYIWLAIFITGILLYNLSLNRYLIDWLFPQHPSLGWRFTIHFLHVGLAGFYLLILGFWKIKEKKPELYRIGQGVLCGILLLSILSFFINNYLGNFKLMSQVNSAFLVVQMTYIIRLLFLWKNYDRHERYLGYGVLLYLLVAIFLTFALFVLQESVFNLFSILSGILLVSVSLFFLAGISGKLWQNEKDKNLYLTQLNELQKHQNEQLEQSVGERTQELKLRNEHVELLMNELNHRVKNNLQLLYGLNILQLEASKEKSTNNILRDNITRIKAMMLVNERLNPARNLESKNISPADFIADIAAHSKIMFPPAKPVEMSIHIDPELILEAKAGLCVGLIVTELITNSYKHAFSDCAFPAIHIEIVRDGVYWTMTYQDNGKGITSRKEESFGLRLISDLTRQLKGKYHVSSQDGITYIFNFPNLI